ncbi:rhomboid family intramembrane serine protease [uncultured Capnocytophaga sp.]|uniref:rhomboid family intramembrane serine protease n=1 Tax=uncultured Capnocytophaga sp. TaxID=159273 RepID=UPI00260421E0|nr:rhomboid family intramembrane serine protease [uncultured Capnocytophaga sp.]
MNRIATNIWAKHSLGIIYILMIGYLCAYIFPLLIAFLWQIEVPFVRDYLALWQHSYLLAERPWTLLSYSLFHASLLHCFFNAIMLYFVGVLFMNLFTPKRFLSIYVGGVVAGGLLFMLLYAVLPVFAGHDDYLLGASAGIMAPLLFLATYTPSYRIYLFGIFSIPLWTIGALLVLIDLVSIPIGNAGGHIAHLGGALVGFLYALHLKGGFRRLLPKRKAKTAYQGKYPNQATEERINTILDKISKSGYDSLTKEEKKFLFVASKEED